MKKSSTIIILFIVSLLFVSGCESNNTNSTSKKSKESTQKTQTNGEMKQKFCVRQGKGTKDAEVELSYNLLYTDNILNMIESTEKVISDDQENLDTYEDAYNNIHKHYKGLKYYDTNVVRDENSVTSTIMINYDKIDIKKLLDIEGEEDNIIVNGKADVDKWLELAKRFGTKCEDVE